MGKDKFTQVVEVIMAGMIKWDPGEIKNAKMFPALDQIMGKDGWSTRQGTINSYEAGPGTMAQQYLAYLYTGAPKPEWLSHMGF